LFEFSDFDEVLALLYWSTLPLLLPTSTNENGMFLFFCSVSALE